jgi:chromosome segregation ATPase
MSRQSAAVKPTPGQQIEQLKVKTKNLEVEITSARSLNEEATVDSARARSRIRRMGEEVESESRDIDAEIDHLEWSVELASQERTKLLGMVDSANATLESTIAKYTQHVAQKKQEYAEQEALLKSELQMYNTELETLREFQSQRAQMEEELRRLDEELLRQRQVHQETMEQFRAQLKREQDHYERVNRQRVREAEQAAVNIKDECLEAAAIRCIQDSQAVSHQLRKNQFKSRDILNANTELIHRIDSLKRENQLLTEREKMLIEDVAKYRQRIEAMKAKMSEDEVSYTKERARIETESATKIEMLEKECSEIEKENSGLEKQIGFMKQRTEELEGQQKMSSNKQSQLMRLLTSTAPMVLDSLKSVDSEANQPAPLQALITKLNEALEEGEPPRPEVAPPPKMVSTPVQTPNPNMKFF